MEQVFFRGWYEARKRFGASKLRLNPPGAPKWDRVAPKVAYAGYPGFDLREILSGRFRFLNQPASCTGPDRWAAPGQSRLWRYNLHYFQYLFPEGGLAPASGFSLIRDWMALNPPRRLDAWDPFPISLRLVNWTKYLSQYMTDQTLGAVPILRSAYAQALWLERSLERHLLANHFFKNLKALLFLGLFFKGKDARRWPATATRFLKREIPEQILSDGGHFERSPMYHSMILEDCLDLLNVCESNYLPVFQALASDLKEPIRNMVHFLAGMCHPDGQIGLFNDAALGIESAPSDLFTYYEQSTGDKVEKPKPPCWSFPETGYFIMAPQDGNRLIIDCGPIGPDYQTGHSHCDTLSFELSLKGKRVIVDSGCCQYEDGPIRKYNRGNEGHNTLTVDGQNQSEVWGAHRCARRAKPLYAKLREERDGTIIFEGAHDGYRRLRGRPIHHRRIVWHKNTYLIEDRIEGRGQHDIESRLHINPALTIRFSGTEATIFNGRKQIVMVSIYGEGRMEKDRGYYCPEFGIKKDCVVLRTVHQNQNLPFKGGWVIQVAG